MGTKNILNVAAFALHFRLYQQQGEQAVRVISSLNRGN
jgi:hypothetical protein